MKDHKINSDELARDLAYHCLAMIKIIYRLDDVKDSDLEDEFYHKVKTSIKSAIKDIEERLNLDKGGEQINGKR